MIFLFILVVSGISAACIGLTTSVTSLKVLRGFIALSGVYLLVGQYWMMRMFSKNIAGTVCAFVAGAGTFGGAFVQRFIRGVLLGSGTSSWRLVGIFPCFLGIASSVCSYFFSDDTPQGGVWERRTHGSLRTWPGFNDVLTAMLDYKVWVLFFQLAGSQGVELTMKNAAVLYLRSEFGISGEDALGLVNPFGWLHWPLRVVGGLVSDVVNSSFGTVGRILVQGALLLVISICILVFDGASTTLGVSIVLVRVILTCAQMAQGSTFALVPGFSLRHLGYAVGIVSAGGNAGAVVYGLTFRNHSYQYAINVLGWCTLASAIASVLLLCPALVFNKQNHFRLQMIGEEKHEGIEKEYPETKGIEEKGHNVLDVQERVIGMTVTDNKQPGLEEYGA